MTILEDILNLLLKALFIAVIDTRHSVGFLPIQKMCLVERKSLMFLHDRKRAP
jgi:hypothetical protein